MHLNYIFVKSAKIDQFFSHFQYRPTLGSVFQKSDHVQVPCFNINPKMTYSKIDT